MEKKKVMAQFVWLSLPLGDHHCKEENKSQEKWWVSATKNKKYENTGHLWMHFLVMNSEYHRWDILSIFSDFTQFTVDSRQDL